MSLPEGRTELYMIWRSCERFGMIPPKIKTKWYDNSYYSQALLLAYNSIRMSEERGMVVEELCNILKTVR